MNLQKLFEVQAGLDYHITKEHPVKEGEDRLSKKILALQVELGELANEWRGFKFWSNDQKPRREKIHYSIAGIPLRKSDPLLEEYVDCLHFLLSIGLESEIGTFTGDELMPIKMGTIEIQFITIFKATVTFLEDISYYQEMWELFLGLGEMLGFSWEEVEQAYMEKNRINHQRQLNHY